MQRGVGEEAGRGGGEGEFEDAEVGGVGEDVCGPEGELARAGCEVGLQRVEGGEGGVGGWGVGC